MPDRTQSIDRSHVPVRTCVGCRERAAKGELVRIVADGSSITVDRRQVMPGRGAYVHQRDRCIERATMRGGLARSFRRRLTAEPHQLREEEQS